jgi:hypothetical protein
VAELVDALDSKSSSARSAGSIPARGTSFSGDQFCQRQCRPIFRAARTSVIIVPAHAVWRAFPSTEEIVQQQKAPAGAPAAFPHMATQQGQKKRALKIRL